MLQMLRSHLTWSIMFVLIFYTESYDNIPVGDTNVLVKYVSIYVLPKHTYNVCYVRTHESFQMAFTIQGNSDIDVDQKTGNLFQTPKGSSIYLKVIFKCIFDIR